MRQASANAWPPYCRRWEGVTTWMYLDTKGKVTVGTGNLIDSVAAAQAIPWIVRVTGKAATKAQVETEWRRVKALTNLQHLNGLNRVWSDGSKLRISQATVDKLLAGKTAEFWSGIKRLSLPDLESFPADAQLAVMDLAWQNGFGFIELTKDGKHVWAGTRAALLAKDFAAAAGHVPGSGDRAEFRKRLFLNADKVQAWRLDPDRLWDTSTPTKPTPEGFDMAAAKDVYKATAKPLTVPAATSADIPDTTLKIDDDGHTSVVVGVNAGVDVSCTVLLEATEAGTDVALWARLVDTLAKDGSDAKKRRDRWRGYHSIAPGGKRELTALYKGEIPAGSAKDRDVRLRFMIRSTKPITVTNVEITGWEM